MLKNYITTTVRSLRKNLTFSIINILGLAVGIAAFILITAFVRDELTYDKFHKNHNRIYRGQTYFESGFSMAVPETVLGLMKEKMPEVEAITQISYGSSFVMDFNGDKVLEKNFYTVDENLFKVFDFTLKYGNPDDVFKTANGVVISSYMAKKYYGDENPLGKTFKTAAGKKQRIITGVLDEIPKNSQFQFNLLRLHSPLTAERIQQWRGSGDMYALFTEPIDEKKIGEKMMAMAQENGYNMKGSSFNIDNFGQLYLGGKNYSNDTGASGKKEFIYIFSGIGILLLVLASINYVNSSTAKSLTRLKEIGIRKVVGASETQVRTQFLIETGFFAFLAIVLAAGLAEYFLPTLNELSGKELSLNYFSDGFTLGFLLLMIPIITLMAGFYPAFFAGRMKTLKVLKGQTAGGKGLLRKYLVAFQLVITLLLLFSTQIINNQIDFFLDNEVGLNTEGVVNTFLPQGKTYDVVKEVLEKVPGVEAVTASPFPSTGGSQMGIEYVQDNEKKSLKIYPIRSALNVNEVLGIEIVKGRDFIQGSIDDMDNSVLISESVAKIIGFENPIGETIKAPNDEYAMSNKIIVGVYKDLNFNLKSKNIHRIISPSKNLYIVNIKLNKADMEATLLRIGEAWLALDEFYPFKFNVMQDQIESNYAKEQKFGTIIKYFSFIAIFIAGLGLFGLSNFSVIQKHKEIGIRKILGASVFSVTSKFISNYFWLIFLAAIIAIPLAYYVMDGWLVDFANHINIGVMEFTKGILVVILIVVITVGYQSLKAALSNPISVLRDE